MKAITIAATLAAFASPALAEGDAAAGEERDDTGEVLAGRSARTGPNLYAIAGRTLGSIEDFRYGDAIVALGEAGTTWDEETFVAFVQNPTDYLREATEDPRARGKMAYQVRDPQEAADIYAFLATFGAE